MVNWSTGGLWSTGVVNRCNQHRNHYQATPVDKKTLPIGSFCNNNTPLARHIHGYTPTTSTAVDTTNTSLSPLPSTTNSLSLVVVANTDAIPSTHQQVTPNSLPLFTQPPPPLLTHPPPHLLPEPHQLNPLLTN